MNRAEAIKILDNHSMEYRMMGDWLQVLHNFTVNGVGGSEWVLCPSTRRDLAIWLGY